MQQYKNTWLFSYQALLSYWYHACQPEKLYVRFQMKCISFSNLIQTFFLSSLNYESILATIRICVRKYACLLDIMRNLSVCGVCVSLCLCGYIPVFVYILLFMCAFVCKCVCICVDVYMCVHVRSYMFLLGVNTCVCFLPVFARFMSLLDHLCLHVSTCVRACVSVCACGPACMCACVIFQNEYSRTIINILPSYVPSSTKVEKNISSSLFFTVF